MSGNEKPDFLDSMEQQLNATAAVEPSESDTGEGVEEAAETGATVLEPVTPEPKAAATPAAATKDQAEQVPLAALMSEREKRQQYEKELERYRSAEREAAQKPTDFYQNPEQHIAEVVATVEQRAQNRMYAALEAEALVSFPDYDEVFAEVEAYAKGNPAAVQEVLSAPNPARAAYELGKRIREHREMQNPEAYREKLKAQLRAEWEAEQADKAKQAETQAAVLAEKAAAIPPDISKTASASANTSPRRSPMFNQLFDKPS